MSLVTCPNQCSHRGKCASLRQLAALQEANGVILPPSVYGSNPNAISTWDADTIFGCQCGKALTLFGDAPRFTAYDCSELPCPKGDDPWTLNQANEVQAISCTADGGLVSISFRDFSTNMLPFNAAASRVQQALESLPSIGRVSVTMTAGVLCSLASPSTINDGVVRDKLRSSALLSRGPVEADILWGECCSVGDSHNYRNY
ncbi:hypothetical protein AaE_014574 [Aphanomyces astaci]|uniref:Uncharacterized protein n=1 Tax=Aphanomyces astaci TaxID=112090 RepID=A0A6A4Z5C5_APHAT|nr:hypothetical protein AaE_014574 [Aphanomyces astaci]